MSLRTTIRRRNERGIAMLVAIMAVVLLAIIGLGFMFMADTENSVNNSYKDAQKSYFASRAGLENVRLLLIPPDPKTGGGAGPLYGPASLLTMPTSAAPSGVIYVENPTGATDLIDPTTALGATLAANPTLDDQICQEQFTGLPLAGTGGAPCESTGQLLTAATPYFQPVTPTTNPGIIINTNTAAALPFKWVRITNKQNLMGTLGARVDNGQLPGAQVCWDGSKQYVSLPPPDTCFTTPSPAVTSMMPVWVLTSLAVTPALGNKPGSRRITQMEVASSPPLIPNAPIATEAPITLEGSYVLNSYDNCTCKCTTSGTGSDAKTTCTDLSSTVSCNKKAYAIETGGTVDVNGGSGVTVSAQPSPYQTNVQPWPFDINQLINTYKQNSTSPNWSKSCSGTANFTATPPQYLSCGTQSSQQFGTYPSGLPTEPDPSSYTSVTEYIPGSVKLTSDATGSGILIVDGDLEINGGLSWYGLILVRGKVSFTGGGNDAVNLYGSVLAGEDVLAVNNTVSDTFGGSINFHYDICALRRSGPQVPPKILTTHEISF
jgi:hypothetical protein